MSSPQMSSAVSLPGSRSVNDSIVTATSLVLVMTARNGTSAPSSGATSASRYSPMPSALLVFTMVTVTTGGGVTVEGSSSVSQFSGSMSSQTSTSTVLTLSSSPGAGA